MSLFYYKAINTDGKTEEGEMDAMRESAVATQLQESGYLPILVQPASTSKPTKSSKGLFQRRRRLSANEVTLFTSEMATLLGAGLPLDYALETIMEVTDDESLRRLVAGIYDRVRDGAAFSTAIEAQEDIFSEMYINMIRAGETAGALDKTLARLTDYLKRMKEFRESILSAITYPVILILVAGISVIVLLMFVIPQFSQMFVDMGSVLPLPTRIVMNAGELLRSYWWVPPLLILGGIVTFRSWLSTPNHRLRWHKLLLRLPLAGDLFTKIEIARFTRTLGIMLGNGVSLLQALEIVQKSISNSAMANDVTHAAEKVAGGRGLAMSLNDCKSFPKLSVKMIRVGEESGQLEDMLLQLAVIYDDESQATLRRLLSLLEPILIVGLGLLIAGIILSILVAVLGMNQLIV